MPEPSAPDAVAFSVFLRLLWQHRKEVIRITAIVVVAATIYAFIMPQTFTSTVTMLPPKKEERSSGLMSMLAGVGTPDMFDLGATLGFGTRSSDIFVKILGSRTVSDSLIQKFHLDRFFGISPSLSWRHAAVPLGDATAIESSKDGMITVTVSLSTGYFASQKDIDSIKNFAATIANEYVRFLDIVNREKMVSSARSSRVFVQQQLVQTRDDLDSAYNDLVAYQESHRALMVDKQLDALVTSAATLKAQLAESAVEFGIARRDMKANSRALLNLQARVEELQKQYDQLQSGSGRDGDFVLAFEKLPKVAKNLSLLLRKVKVLEEVNAFLNKQYYQERLQEERDLPTVQVLDEAIPAYKRAAPRRAQWMVMSAFVGFFGSVLFVLGRDAARRYRARHPKRV
jgi:tyrosine-protein kinase Etk/Wzc